MCFPALVSSAGNGGKRTLGGSPCLPTPAPQPPLLPPGFQLCPLPQSCTLCLIQLPEAQLQLCHPWLTSLQRLPASSQVNSNSSARHSQPAMNFLPPMSSGHAGQPQPPISSSSSQPSLSTREYPLPILPASGLLSKLETPSLTPSPTPSLLSLGPVFLSVLRGWD